MNSVGVEWEKMDAEQQCKKRKKEKKKDDIEEGPEKREDAGVVRGVRGREWESVLMHFVNNATLMVHDKRQLEAFFPVAVLIALISLRINN